MSLREIELPESPMTEKWQGPARAECPFHHSIPFLFLKNRDGPSPKDPHTSALHAKAVTYFSRLGQLPLQVWQYGMPLATLKLNSARCDGPYL